MYLSRRTFLQAGLIASVPSSLRRAYASTGAEDLGTIPDLPDDLKTYITRDDVNRVAAYGKAGGLQGVQPPKPEERKIATQIITNATVYSKLKPLAPIDVAYYFLSIAQNSNGTFPGTWPAYTRAWPAARHRDPIRERNCHCRAAWQHDRPCGRKERRTKHCYSKRNKHCYSKRKWW